MEGGGPRDRGGVRALCARHLYAALSLEIGGVDILDVAGQEGVDGLRGEALVDAEALQGLDLEEAHLRLRRDQRLGHRESLDGGRGQGAARAVLLGRLEDRSAATDGEALEDGGHLAVLLWMLGLVGKIGDSAHA